MKPFLLNIDILPINIAIYKKEYNDFIFVAFNKEAERTERIDRNQLLGHKLTEVFPAVKDFGLYDVLLRVYDSGKSEVYESTFYKDNRVSGWRKNHIYKLADGTVAAIYRDTSIEKELEIHGDNLKKEINEVKKSIYYQKALEKSENKLKNIVETSTDWVWEVNQYGIYTYSSPIVEKILGYSKSEIIGKTPFNFMPPDEANRVLDIFNKHLENKTSITNLENINIHKNGSKVILSTSAAPILNNDDQLIGYIGLDRDVTLEKKIAQDLIAEKKELLKAQTLSLHDPLTDLPNRRYFKEYTGNKLAQAIRYNKKIAFFYIDLDGFKAINDEISHQVGDDVLVHIAKRFEKFLRKNEFIARIGGDEFCMVVDDFKDKNELKTIAERIIDKSCQTFTAGAKKIKLGMTIGIALYPEDGKSFDELLSAADLAMYDAKKTERGSYVFVK